CQARRSAVAGGAGGPHAVERPHLGRRRAGYPVVQPRQLVRGRAAHPKDSVRFDATSARDVLLDIDVSVASFAVDAGYTGSIDLGGHTLRLSGDLTRSGGTLSASAATLRLEGGADQTVDFGPGQALGTLAVDKSGGVLTFYNGFAATTLSVSSGDTVK